MVTAVIGAQYGSEGKGKVIEHLAHEYDVFVRVGGPNAGHVIYYNGERFTMRSVPCGWINMNAKLMIGAGAVINIDLLFEEIKKLEQYDPIIRKRLYIDKHAMVITNEHMDNEKEMMSRIGSTGQGVGEARIERIRRTAKLAKDYKILRPFIADVSKLLDLYKGFNILLEGTQGTHLSLYHGQYPYVTSHDANVAQLLADVGIAPKNLNKVIVVIRAYPIRVGGKSGPMHREVSFPLLESRIGKQIERTSVTKKVRRIGMLDVEQLEKTRILNSPTHFALMFTDYIDPSVEGVTEFKDLTEEIKRYVHGMWRILDAKPLFISTGVNSMVKLDG